ncbi:TPA: hypothetical protein JAN54_05530 [Legionella pneumophila]|nr:hypothetical protein [Legionella pneumophila]HBC0467238.1 hypothetical protein [Legionella pneumophila]HDV6633808.1 hypothetical protein [Legionella pneumophila]
MSKFTLSQSEATILGITESGWFELIKDAGVRYTKVYGWSSNPLRRNVPSAYQLYENSKELKSLLLLKSQFNLNHKNQIEFLINQITPFLPKFPGKLNCILWCSYCEMCGENFDIKAIKKYFSEKSNNLITMCQLKNIPLENVITALVMKNSSPDLSFDKSLHSIGSEDLLYLLNQLHNQIKSGIKQVNTKTNKKDHNLSASKRIIIDTLQENIMRFYEGRELIPIEMVIMKHSKNEKGFYPDFSSVINKGDKYYSSAELRMIYKLMEEIPDDDIKKIMRNTFFLKEMTTKKSDKNLFKTLENPWDSHELIGGGIFWKKRQRKDNKVSYDARPKEFQPNWVHDLIAIKELYKEKHQETKSLEKKH